MRAALDQQRSDRGGATRLSRLSAGLRRTSARVNAALSRTCADGIDQRMLSELEEGLIAADLGPDLAARLCAGLARANGVRSEAEALACLAGAIADILRPRQGVLDVSGGKIIFFVGVNGSGKTTTIGKLAARLDGSKTVIAACDTFRAAAVAQLRQWSDRAGASFVGPMPAASAKKADPASIAFRAGQMAAAQDGSVLLVDTAGRLHTRSELMAELSKMVRAVRKLDPEAPHEVIIVVDAGSGHNALAQIEGFRHAAGVTGLIVTKLDGSARGGVVVAVAERFDLPIHYVGLGEGAGDIQPFEASAFARALVGLDSAYSPVRS